MNTGAKIGVAVASLLVVGSAVGLLLPRGKSPIIINETSSGSKSPYLPEVGSITGHGLPDERRSHGGRGTHGRTLERKNHRPLRPAQR